MARKLVVEIIGDASRLTRSFNQSTTAANKFGAEVSGSMGKAEKSLTKLQRVAAGGFIGAAAFSAGVVALRKVIGEKNELFFHRHRPQNETYLFLFRKHEQGNNAVEIPQFDPLIEAKEREIVSLTQESPRTP